MSKKEYLSFLFNYALSNYANLANSKLFKLSNESAPTKLTKSRQKANIGHAEKLKKKNRVKNRMARKSRRKNRKRR